METIKCVLGFAFTESNPKSVALILKQRPDFQKGLFNGIGGKIEPNEDPLDAMAREFKEETDVYISKKDWYFSCILSIGNYEIHCYKAFNELVNFVRTVTDEGVCLFSLHNLPENKMENLTWLIPLMLTSDTLMITDAS